MRILRAVAVAACILSAGCGSEQEEREACYRKGISYYREIGSYPTLSDGRDANTVIGDRCARSKIAFG